jgi:hypothetical protein
MTTLVHPCFWDWNVPDRKHLERKAERVRNMLKRIWAAEIERLRAMFANAPSTPNDPYGINTLAHSVGGLFEAEWIFDEVDIDVAHCFLADQSHYEAIDERLDLAQGVKCIDAGVARHRLKLALDGRAEIEKRLDRWPVDWIDRDAWRPSHWKNRAGTGVTDRRASQHKQVTGEVHVSDSSIAGHQC